MQVPGTVLSLSDNEKEMAKMIVLSVEEGNALVPPCLIRDKILSSEARCLYLSMQVDLHPKHLVSLVDPEDLMNASGLKRDAIESACRELEKRGVVTIDRQQYENNYATLFVVKFNDLRVVYGAEFFKDMAIGKALVDFDDAEGGTIQ